MRFQTALVAAIAIAAGYAYFNSHGDLFKQQPKPGTGVQPSGQVPPARSSGSGTVFVFSNGAEQPRIDDFINSAATSLDMTMYELSDTTAVNDLVARHKAGVNVRVILDQAEKSTDQAAYDTLKAAGIGVVWSSPAFAYTHQKTITVDQRESLILTGNLTSTYYPTGRDYGAFDTDARDVASVVSVFDADYGHAGTNPDDADGLLWSPTTARPRILDVIDHATKTLDVEGEEFSDSAVVDAIVARARAGVAVRVMVESPSSYRSEVDKVVAAGGKVSGYSSSNGLYIHAKAVIADAGQSDARMELGSMNLTSTSLGRNRELGIVLTDANACRSIDAQFSADFAGAAPQ